MTYVHPPNQALYPDNSGVHPYAIEIVLAERFAFMCNAWIPVDGDVFDQDDSSFSSEHLFMRAVELGIGQKIKGRAATLFSASKLDAII